MPGGMSTTVGPSICRSRDAHAYTVALLPVRKSSLGFQPGPAATTMSDDVVNPKSRMWDLTMAYTESAGLKSM